MIEWYWWILMIACYCFGGVYFGTRFRWWGRNKFCKSGARGYMCADCNAGTGFVVVLWPFAIPPFLLVTWLYRTATRQSTTSKEERRQAKFAEREATARAERHAIEAEQRAVAAKTELMRQKQALQHASDMLLPDAFVPRT